MTEIETIFCSLFKCDRSRLYLGSDKPVPTLRQVQKLDRILSKRMRGEPLQYLLGEVEFMGLGLKVGNGVFIPRPETEILVETALDTMRRQALKAPRILDVGTGSGNIAVSLAVFLPQARMTAVDISEVSLKTAAANARRHHAHKRVDFLRSDLLRIFEDESIIFDYILSNPPYLPHSCKDALSRDVRCEPSGALFAEEKGMSFYRRMEVGVRRFLKSGGTLFFEIGHRQGVSLKKIFKDGSIWGEVDVKKDYNGFDRVAVIRKV